MKLYKKDKGNVFITASLESSEQGEHGLQESSSARLDSRKPHPSATPPRHSGPDPESSHPATLESSERSEHGLQECPSPSSEEREPAMNLAQLLALFPEGPKPLVLLEALLDRQNTQTPSRSKTCASCCQSEVFLFVPNQSILRYGTNEHKRETSLQALLKIFRSIWRKLLASLLSQNRYNAPSLSQTGHCNVWDNRGMHPLGSFSVRTPSGEVLRCKLQLLVMVYPWFSRSLCVS